MDGTQQPADAFRVLSDFWKGTGKAMLLLRVAAHDYAAARCLLFNCMFEGLVLGAQSIEKCLKAYLLLHDPQRHVKALRHSLPKLLEETIVLFPQTANALCVHALASARPRIVYFTTINNAKFRKPVIPGDRIEYHMSKIAHRRNIWRYRGEAKVDGQLVCEAEVSAMLVTDAAVENAT
jgi:hypothetical protein